VKKKVLIPLDGTDMAERALQIVDLIDKDDEVVLFAAGEPEDSPQRGTRPGRAVLGDVMGPAGGSVTDVPRPDVPLYVETKDQELQEKLAQLNDYLEGMAAGLRKDGYRVDVVAEISASPAQAIIDCAMKVQPTFIAMVRTTHRSLADRVFGTVAQQVIRSDVAPVMILPGA
jgi:nucleotide-binding universal stress UspA family protein